jgi:hypothetical protein
MINQSAGSIVHMHTAYCRTSMYVQYSSVFPSMHADQSRIGGISLHALVFVSYYQLLHAPQDRIGSQEGCMILQLTTDKAL